MQIKYTHRYDDDLAFQEHFINTNPVMKKQKMMGTLIVALSWILTMLFILNVEKYNKIAVFVLSACTIIFAPFLIFYHKKYYIDHAIKTYKKLNSENDKNRERDYIASIESNVLKVENKTSKTEIDAKSIRKIEDNDRFYFLFLTETSALSFRKEIPSIDTFVDEIKNAMQV